MNRALVEAVILPCFALQQHTHTHTRTVPVGYIAQVMIFANEVGLQITAARPESAALS